MRVLVCRPAAQANRTASRLTELGHRPLVAPVLTIVPTQALPPPGELDAIVVTSRNAVAALEPHRARFGATRVFAVGPRTAEALAEAGFAELRIASGDGASLAAAVIAGTETGARLLHIAGRDRRPEPARSLREAGRQVDVWEAYAAEPALVLPEPARAALASGSVDAVLHYSARSAELLVRLVREAGLAAPFLAPRHLCLSAAVAAALGDMPRLAVAAEPGEDRLLALLDEAASRTD